MRKLIVDVDFDFFVREPQAMLWDHSESHGRVIQDVIWHSRCMSAVQQGVDLSEITRPPDGPTPETFWQELVKRGWSFDDVKLLYSDSHAVVGMEIPAQLSWGEEYEIVHFDAHHDLGYNDSSLIDHVDGAYADAGSWLFVVGMLMRQVKKITIVYPEWRRQPCPLAKKFDLAEERLGGDRLTKRREALATAGTELEVLYWDDMTAREGVVDLVSVCQSSAWVPPWMDSQFQVLLDGCPNVSELDELDDPRWPNGFEIREGWNKTWAEIVERVAPQLPPADMLSKLQEIAGR